MLTIAIPVVLGFIAVYLLLPRPRALPAWWGALFAALALIAAGWLLIAQQMAKAETILFYAFSFIALVSAALLITQRNPVRAALSFALVVLSTCGLFLLQAAPFLMAATIIIYAGAIIVTFLFVIMLAQQEGISNADFRSREPVLSCIAGFVLLVALLYALGATYDTRQLDELLARTSVAAEEPTEASMRQAIGNDHEFFASFRSEAERSRATGGVNEAFQTAINDAQATWSKSPGNIKAMHDALTRLYETGLDYRIHYGTIPPADKTKYLASYSHLPSQEPGNAGPRDSAGRSQLPAQNVGYLGRMLFTEYLIPVELGGTLLLVATIGTIAIAARRTEGLR
jgi:NADH-quinone oxidoreductase subunit J